MGQVPADRLSLIRSIAGPENNSEEAPEIIKFRSFFEELKLVWYFMLKLDIFIRPILI